MAYFNDKFYANLQEYLNRYADIKKDATDEERTETPMNAREELKEIYKRFNRSVEVIPKYSRCLNLLYLEGQLDPCYHRDQTLVSMQKILLRKNKANVLLTGAAGCGKTALAEGLAAIIAERRVAWQEERNTLHKAYLKAHKAWKRACAKAIDNDTDEPVEPQWIEPPKPHLASCVIYDLSLNALVGGTKYRGEFEERLQQVLDECKKNPNIILFIDEIHQIGTVGASDGSEGAAQILKPALARNDIRVIGATTTEEKAYITKDKALARRFCEVEVAQLVGEPAVETAEKILVDYCKFHKVSTEVCATDILAKVQFFLPQSVFPDNIINVIDEALAGAVFDGLKAVDMSHFNAVLSRMTGLVIVDE